MTSISIPAGVERIDPAFFQLFPNAASVTVAGDNPHFRSFNGMLLSEQMTSLLLVPEGMEGVAVLPESLATVPAYVISRCKKLYGLSFQPGSTGNNAFTTQDGVLYTNDLTTLLAAPAGIGASVAIAAECTAIAEGAFWGNDGLKTIISNGDVSDIAADAENAETSTDAPVPASAFNPETIEAATVITEDRAAWEAAGFTHFAEPAKPGDATTLAPDESGFVYTLMEDGHLSVKWAGDAPATGERTIVESATLHGVNYTVTTIEDGAFRDQVELTGLTLPSTITSIGDSAFAGCTALGSIQIPGGTVSIGASAFEGCTSLASIALGSGLRTIGERAFAGTALPELILPASVQSIGSSAFAGCEQLRTIVARGTVAHVSETALADTAGVSIYAPYAEDGDYTWNIGPVASANHLLPYGARTAQDIYQLTVGDELNAFEGGYLHAPEGIEATVSYKASIVNADATGYIVARQPGISTVTYTIAHQDIELAKATCSVTVRHAVTVEPPNEAPIGAPTEQEGSSDAAEDESAETDEADDGQDAAHSAEATDAASEDESLSEMLEGVEVETRQITPAMEVAQGIDFETSSGVPMISRSMSLDGAQTAAATYTHTVTATDKTILLYARAAINDAIQAPMGGTFSGTFTWVNSISGTPSSNVESVLRNEDEVRVKITRYTPVTAGNSGVQYTKAMFDNTYGSDLVHFSIGSNGAQIKVIDILNAITGNSMSFSLRGKDFAQLHKKPCMYHNQTELHSESLKLPNLHICDHRVNCYYQASTFPSVTLFFNSNSSKTPGAPPSNYDSASTYYLASGRLSYVSTPELTTVGYKHIGWSTNPSATTATYKPNEIISLTLTGNRTYYAVWKKLDKITFNVNGGTGSVPASVYAERGSGMPSIGSNKPTRSGYVFLGWYGGTNASGSSSTSGTRYYDDTNKSIVSKWDGTGDTTLYAHWGYRFTVKYPYHYQYATSTGEMLADYNYRWVEGSLTSGAVNGDVTPLGLFTRPLDMVDENCQVGLVYDKDFNLNWYARPANGATLYAYYLFGEKARIDANTGTLGSVTAASVIESIYGSRDGGHAYHYGVLFWNSGGGYSNVLGSGDFGLNGALPKKEQYKFLGLYDASSGGNQELTDDGNNVHRMTERYNSSYNPITLYAQWDYAKYTIRYNKNNSDATGTMDSTYGYWGTNPTISKCTFGAPPGMEFNGWNTKDDGTGTKVPGSTVVNTTYGGDLSTTNGGSVTLYAQWVPRSFGITLTGKDADSGKAGTTAVYVKYGIGFYSDEACTTSITKITSPQRTGYAFGGYEGLTDKDGKITAKNTDYTANAELNPTWLNNVYTITLSGKDADTNQAGTQSVYLKYNDGYYSNSTCTASAKITEIVRPSRIGYDFNGYSGLTDKDGNITASATAFTESKTIDPSWNAYTCTILFDANFTGSTYATQTFTFTFSGLASASRIPANPFEHTNYEFKEWNTAADGSSSVYADNALISDTFAKAVANSENHTMKLYAQWTQVAFNVTFEANGGSAVPSEYVGVDELIPDKLNPPATTRPGYTLEGWYADESLNTRWDFATSKMPREDVTLYAKWAHNTFTVTFKAGRGEGAEQVRTYTYEAVDADGGPLAQELPDFDRDLGFSCTGGTFKGWTQNEIPAPDEKYWMNRADVRMGLSYGEDVTLYAQWDPVSYFVFFDPNRPADSSVSGNMPMQQLTYMFPGQTADQQLAKNAYTCTGYEFMGWNTVREPSDEEPGVWYDDEAVVPNLTDVFGVVPLYAQWKGAPYTVHFEANVPAGEAVEGTMADQTLDWGLSQKLTPNSFRRPGGWVFAGWNTQPDGSGTPYGDEAWVRNLRPEAGQDRPTLYAQWSIAFDIDVPTVDHINVTMNEQGEWITVDGAAMTIQSRSPLPIGIEGVGLEGDAAGLNQMLEDPSQASQLVLNLSSQGTTVPLSPGTTATDANYYFRLEKGTPEVPATLPVDVDLTTRNPGIRLKESIEPTTAFRLTFLLSVIQS